MNNTKQKTKKIKKKTKKIRTTKNEKIRITPLGGVEEVAKKHVSCRNKR